LSTANTSARAMRAADRAIRFRGVIANVMA
jgi:hypothetical protein